MHLRRLLRVRCPCSTLTSSSSCLASSSFRFPSLHHTTRFHLTGQVSSVSARLGRLDQSVHPKVQTLLLGFVGGIVFTSLYNKEWPGYERRLLKKARKGDSEAQVVLGELYLNDEKYNSKSRAKKRAFEWFCNSADQGNQRAHYYLGLLHKNKNLEASNDKAAYYHFNIAALSPSQTDTINLSGKKPQTTVAKWLDESTRSNARFELALCYLSGTGCDRDVQKGLSTLELIGKEGNVQAAAKLSEIYLNGSYGISVNSTKGLSWKREAGRLGDKTCSKEMTELYISKGKDLIDTNIVPIDKLVALSAAKVVSNAEQEEQDVPAGKQVEKMQSQGLGQPQAQ